MDSASRQNRQPTAQRSTRALPSLLPLRMTHDASTEPPTRTRSRHPPKRPPPANEILENVTGDWVLALCLLGLQMDISVRKFYHSAMYDRRQVVRRRQNLAFHVG